MKVWYGSGWCRYWSKTGLGTMLLTRLLISGEDGLIFWSLMLAVTFLWVVCIAFFNANSKAVANHVGGDGTAPDPLIWSADALPERRRIVHAVRDRAFFAWVFGMVNGSPLMQHLSLLRMLALDHTQSGSWLNGFLS